MSAPVRNASASTEIPSPFQFDSVEDAVAAIGNGEFVVVMDDESRENEGDVVCAAGRVTTEGMAWMVKWTRWVQIVLLKCQSGSRQRTKLAIGGIC